MLTPLDDTLRHQLPDTFDHVYTSDPGSHLNCMQPTGGTSSAGFQICPAL